MSVVVLVGHELCDNHDLEIRIEIVQASILSIKYATRFSQETISEIEA